MDPRNTSQWTFNQNTVIFIYKNDLNRPSPKLRPICLGHSMKTVKYLCCDPCTFSLSSHLAAHSIQPSDPKVMAHRRCTLRRTWCVRGGTGMFTVGYHEGQMVNLPSGDVYFMRYWIRFDWIAWKHPRSTCHAWYTLRWRHNEHEGVSNHQPHDCLLNRLSRRTSKKTSKLCVTGLCEGNSPGTGEFPAQMASNAENVSIWWRHDDDDF